MSTELIGDEKGYGFQLTQFAGPQERGRMYQITTSEGHVAFDTWQMMQLVSCFLLHHNKEAVKPHV